VSSWYGRRDVACPVSTGGKGGGVADVCLLRPTRQQTAQTAQSPRGAETPLPTCRCQTPDRLPRAREIRGSRATPCGRDSCANWPTVLARLYPQGPRLATPVAVPTLRKPPTSRALRKRYAEVQTAIGSGGATEPEPPPPPSPRTKWTRRVPHPVLIGHAASLTPYKSDTHGRGSTFLILLSTQDSSCLNSAAVRPPPSPSACLHWESLSFDLVAFGPGGLIHGRGLGLHGPPRPAMRHCSA
jgi:hypothetical protein